MTTNATRIVEAALFSAGKPISVDELVQATKLKAEDVKAALAELHQEYSNRETALEVVKSGTKWAMAVRTDFSESTKMLAPPEIPRKVLKTLALIAFHQPVKQSDLKDMVGSVVYDHVHELHERGLVTGRQEGITKILQTTERFAEYFGIDAENRDEIRTALAKAVGLDLSKLPPPAADATPIEATPENPATTDEASADAPVAPAAL